ncbi:MAG: hypothetical protein OXU70_04905 [Gammaproteobacteria bacterium]|nr:hypothetical protein [Gammaproteobacteria bacterium]
MAGGTTEYWEGTVAVWRDGRQAKAFFDPVADRADDAGVRFAWQARGALEQAMGNWREPVVGDGAEWPVGDRACVEPVCAVLARPGA